MGFLGTKSFFVITLNKVLHNFYCGLLVRVCGLMLLFKTFFFSVPTQIYTNNFRFHNVIQYKVCTLPSQCPIIHHDL